ncbi:Virulence factor family protein [Pararobbsia alpina]|uniref:virulence factor family protein n=1 Tax=Pararobbsia alpina TaxID=621374 RepID=UPI0039A68CCB
MKVVKALGTGLVMAGAWLGAMSFAHAETVSGGRYGDVELVRPSGTLRGFVVLFSGRTGWSHTDQDAAEALARNGAMVVGVDMPRYASKLAEIHGEQCHPLVGDAENVSHQLQREVESSQYFSPILAGTGEGALLAERMLAQAPDNTLAGAVAIDPDTTLDDRFNLCPPDPTLSRGKGLPGFLELGATEGTSVKPVQPPKGPPVAVHKLDKGATTVDSLIALMEPHLQQRDSGADSVADLPLIELPAAHPTDMLAVVISGDGGWRDLDKTIAETLQKQGVSVIGIDSLRYFWTPKSPEQTSHDLARILDRYSTRWHARHFALIGYSFGADVMPFAYNRLPQALREKVSFMSLLGFAHAADFQIRVSGWLGLPPSEKALNVAPEIAKVPASRVQCIYGQDEEDTLCPSLAATGVAVVRTSGGHHFSKDYVALTKTILDGWKAQPDVR